MKDAAMEHLSTNQACDRDLVEVAGIDLQFKPLRLGDPTPTGEQILAACELSPRDQYVVLQWLAGGEIEEIRRDENLREEAGFVTRVIVAESDRTFRFVLDDRNMVWPEAEILEQAIRILGRVPAENGLFLRRDGQDRLIEAGSHVDLDQIGTENIYSRVKSWNLNVQGVEITSAKPEISVREALDLAGFDTDASWIIVLKTSTERRQVGLDYVIDLRQPGIEKLRLTPREINNGEAPTIRDRAFALLPIDEAGLSGLGLDWTTVIDGGRRWLILRNVALPTGFNVASTTIAIEIPLSYPAAELDMFYCFPHLARLDGREIPQTQVLQPIGNRQFQRWSRHRGQLAPWRPGKDNVLSHLTLIDASLSREVEQ